MQRHKGRIKCKIKYLLCLRKLSILNFWSTADMMNFSLWFLQLFLWNIFFCGFLWKYKELVLEIDTEFVLSVHCEILSSSQYGRSRGMLWDSFLYSAPKEVVQTIFLPSVNSLAPSYICSQWFLPFPSTPFLLLFLILCLFLVFFLFLCYWLSGQGNFSVIRHRAYIQRLLCLLQAENDALREE